MKQQAVRPEFVKVIPERLEDGVLYICEQYRTVAHNCCCGCGQEVITPLGPADWSLRREGDNVTLHPSIGNWGFPCRSHYFIRRNQVVWLKSMTRSEVERVRRRDRRDKAAYIKEVNRMKEEAPPGSKARGEMERKPSAFMRLLRAFFLGQ
ncbi:DUF6527 family protein [Geothrix paludis]|uniref:DUF6527 family protein n=1 Tax=Geothrix paludis TaxID=2922722 RepID=UPI003C2E9016